MKIKRLPLLTGILVILLLSSFMALNPNGAPAAKTGSPGDGSDCTECHGGTASPVTGWITSNIPASGYVAGQSYQITATNSITGSGKLGFEVSPQNAAGTLLGTLTAGSGSKLVGSGKYVTHSNANTTTNSWTFTWTAPAAGTGAVTFYGAFARNKPGPVKVSTLVVNEASVSLPAAAGPITGPATVCKNNSFTYSIAAISGATSYVWSVPAGASIASGQGTTSISVSFGTSAVSGNVSVYGTNSAGNGTASSETVTVNSAPAQPSAITGTAAACQGTSQSYSVVNISGVIYTWTVPTGCTITAGQGTNSISVSVGGNGGNLTCVPSNSCGNGNSVSKSLTVNSIPGTSATPTGPDLVDLHTSPTSQYTSTGAPSAATYQWEISPVTAGTISGTGLTSTVTWDGAFTGDATIRVKALNDCGEGSWSLVKQTHVINTTGMSEQVNASTFKLFPNPNTGHFTLELNGRKDVANLKIMDASGRIVYESQVNDKGINPFDLSLGSGVYIVIVDEGEQILKQKMFIQ